MGKLATVGTAVRGVIAFVRVARDLDRLDEVFEMLKTIDDKRHVAEGKRILGRTPEGARAFREWPRLDIDLARLRALPEGTFGRTFADHMIANGLDLSAIPKLPVTDDGSFVRAHFYETHDVFHVVTGYGTDVAGELGLQAFYLAQGPARVSAMILAAGFLNLLLQEGRFDDRDRTMREIVHGWLLGRRARPFFGQRWDDMWSLPLDEVRRRLGVDRAAVDQILDAVTAPASPTLAAA